MCHGPLCSGKCIVSWGKSAAWTEAASGHPSSHNPAGIIAGTSKFILSALTKCLLNAVHMPQPLARTLQLVPRCDIHTGHCCGACSSHTTQCELSWAVPLPHPARDACPVLQFSSGEIHPEATGQNAACAPLTSHPSPVPRPSVTVTRGACTAQG